MRLEECGETWVGQGSKTLSRNNSCRKKCRYIDQYSSISLICDLYDDELQGVYSEIGMRVGSFGSMMLMSLMLLITWRVLIR